MPLPSLTHELAGSRTAPARLAHERADWPAPNTPNRGTLVTVHQDPQTVIDGPGRVQVSGSVPAGGSCPQGRCHLPTAFGPPVDEFLVPARMVGE